MTRTVLAAVLATGSVGGVAVAAAVSSASACAPLATTVWQQINPKTTAALLTPWQDEAQIAALTYGFTESKGSQFKVSLTAGPGLIPVHRLFNPKSANFVSMPAGAEATDAVAMYGYVDQGVRFYALASSSSSGCAIPVYRYLKGDYHRQVVDAADRAALSNGGWTLEGISYYVASAAASAPATTPSTTTKPTPPTETTAPTTTTTTIAPPPSNPPASGSPGSAPVGSTSYAVPAGAVFVSPSGADTGSGTIASPLRTVAKAVTKTPSGGTMVLRAGTYHENVQMPREKKLTIQSYPGEAAWFDGSSAVSSFVKSGSTWVRAGWTTKFDSSPTFTRGAADNTQQYYGFINASYPMAAHPDQVWIDGQAQLQVGSLAQVKPGLFYVDYNASKLYLGSDPTGHQVRASDISQAVMILGAGSSLKGVGVRNYAPSLPDFGAVSLRGPGITLENVEVESSATLGISMMSSDITLRNITVNKSGMLGIHGNYADRFLADRVRVTSSNIEHFNAAPSAAGIKLTRSRTVVIKNSELVGNYASAIWFDQSCHDMTVVNNDIRNNTRHGVVVELSSLVLIANNVVSNSGVEGVYLLNTSSARIWNNTIANSHEFNVYIFQEPRTAAAGPGGLNDPRQPWPDPDQTWLIGPVDLKNNVVQSIDGTQANTLVNVVDQTGQRPPSAMGLSFDGNIYSRAVASSPTWVVNWANTRYTTLAQFKAGTGQDAHSYASDGTNLLTSALALTGPAVASTNTIAQPLPTAVAAVVGQPAGTRHLGVWR